MLDTKDPCAGGGPLTLEDRRKIAARMHSLLFWLGRRIPEEIDLSGRMVPLRDVVFNYLEKENPSEEDRRGAMALADALSVKARQMEEEILEEDITRSQACEIMREASALLRAADELLSAKGRAEEVKREHLMRKVEDAKRWDRFVRQFH